jgi:hypothetical protein
MHAGDLPSQINVAAKSAKTFWKDFRERAISTFWQGMVSVLIVAAPTTDWSTLRTTAAAAVVAGGMALFSMAKSLVVRRRGVLNSASTDSSV